VKRKIILQSVTHASNFVHVVPLKILEPEECSLEILTLHQSKLLVHMLMQLSRSRNPLKYDKLKFKFSANLRNSGWQIPAVVIFGLFNKNKFACDSLMNDMTSSSGIPLSN
jgi:hypothetical protein